MAINNRQRVDNGLEHLRIGLAPFVEQEMEAHWKEQWAQQANQGLGRPLKKASNGSMEWDTYCLLKVMWDQWNVVFRKSLGKSERNYVSELQDVRNNHAHEKKFSYEDTERSLDTMRRLLEAVSAPEQAEAVLAIRKELIRVQQAEETRAETRKATAIKGTPIAGLRPWRDVITPHPDVARGDYQQAEFAADLAKVHRGTASSEYSSPEQFFSRTFMTDGLKEMLTIGIRRLTGKGGDPVIELKTNFGGGKTHSMLALYHLFAGGNAAGFPGVESLFSELGVDKLPKANRAVLVGTSIAPGQVSKKKDGTEVRTLWGELAWQLGESAGGEGKEAFAMVADSDAVGTNPGSDILEELLNRYSPCLILIDEWVAFLRQLPGKDNLPAGTFDANMTFAQALTEAVKAVPQGLVVASLPVSDIEIGGDDGAKALERLSNTFKRVAKPWKPATANEGFEIVRRRLFQTDMDYSARDAVVKAFSELYRDHPAEFPSHCREADYRRQMEACYPIHPSLFEQFDREWSTLDKFQRTRGILRLMASVVHELWKREDRTLMIMPSSVTLDASGVRSLITECLPEGPQWDGVISKDVDGPHALPGQIDGDNPNLGRYSACRRAARAIFMGAVPTVGSNNPGLEDSEIRVSCVQPGEAPPTFGDALRRLSDRATHLYSDRGRYWYSLNPTVTRLARDRAAQFEGDPDVTNEILRRIKEDRRRGQFAAIHFVSDSSDTVEDDVDTRLVVLGPDMPHLKRKDQSKALDQASAILMSRGNSPRQFRNALIFAAADSNRLKELEGSVCQYLAWKSIHEDAQSESLDLNNFAKAQAQTKTQEADRICQIRVRETWTCILIPSQPDPTKPEIIWEELSAPASEGALADAASKKLAAQECLFPVLGAPRLKMEMDRYLWGNTNHVNLKQLAQDFASYLYLPRLTNRDVLTEAVRSAFSGGMFCEYFAYATGYDPDRERYTGLQTKSLNTSVSYDGASLLVKPDFATKQEEQEQAAVVGDGGSGGGNGDGPNPPPAGGGDDPVPPPVPQKKKPKRFHGSVALKPSSASLSFTTIAEEVLQHFTSKLGTKVKITVEIEADSEEGFDTNLTRTVRENSRTLGFDHAEFEGD